MKTTCSTGSSLRVAFGPILAAALLAPVVSADELRSGPAPPNILFILSDDQRWDMVGYAGNTLVQTPNLDRLATEGASFSSYYAGAPLCSPSRAILLTGLYPHQAGNGVLGNEFVADFPASTPTVATHLNDAGYVTSFVGKAHLRGDPRSWGFQDTPIWLRKGASEKDEPRLIFNGRERRFRNFNITGLFARTASDFIQRQAASGQPWFLYLSLTSPHAPACATCQQRYPYDQQQIENNPPPGVPPGASTGTFDWADYYSQTTQVDSQVGFLLDALEASGQAANTYVFFTSDNGLTIGRFPRNLKGIWFEDSARMPLVARGPGIMAGITIDDPVVGVDILPTFLEIAGLPVPAGLEGESLLPALLGGTRQRTIVFSEVQSSAFPSWQMIRPFTGIAAGYKYVIELGTGVERLYDLNSDPFEMTDLMAGSPPMDVLDELVQLRQSFLASTP